MPFVNENKDRILTTEDQALLDAEYTGSFPDLTPPSKLTDALKQFGKDCSESNNQDIQGLNEYVERTLSCLDSHIAASTRDFKALAEAGKSPVEKRAFAIKKSAYLKAKEISESILNSAGDHARSIVSHSQQQSPTIHLDFSIKNALVSLFAHGVIQINPDCPDYTLCQNLPSTMLKDQGIDIVDFRDTAYGKKLHNACGVWGDIGNWYTDLARRLTP